MDRSSKSNLFPAKLISRQRRRSKANRATHSALERVSIVALLNPNLEVNSNASMESFYTLNNTSYGLFDGDSAPIANETQATVPDFEKIHYLQSPSVKEEDIIVHHNMTDESISPGSPSVNQHTTQSRSPLLRRYQCASCIQSFDFLYGLKQHKKAVHDGIKDRKCTHPGCNKRYASGGDVSRHFKSVHQLLRPFECLCGAAFTRSYSLKRHVKNNCISPGLMKLHLLQ